MENCFVTKLKASVDRANLPSFDTIIIPCKKLTTASLANAKFSFAGTQLSMTATDGAKLYDYSGNEISQPVTGDSIICYQKYQLLADNYNIAVSNAHSLNFFDVNSNVLITSDFDWSQLAFCTGLTNIKCNTVNGVSFYLDDFYDISNLADFNIARSSLKIRDLNTLGRIIPKTDGTSTFLFGADNSPLSGTIEGLVGVFRGRGITNGSIKMYIYGNVTNITYNGNALVTDTNKLYVLTWTNSSITLTYDGSPM